MKYSLEEIRKVALDYDIIIRCGTRRIVICNDMEIRDLPVKLRQWIKAHAPQKFYSEPLKHTTTVIYHPNSVMPKSFID